MFRFSRCCIHCKLCVRMFCPFKYWLDCPLSRGSFILPCRSIVFHGLQSRNRANACDNRNPSERAQSAHVAIYKIRYNLLIQHCSKDNFRFCSDPSARTMCISNEQMWISRLCTTCTRSAYIAKAKTRRSQDSNPTFELPSVAEEHLL